MLKTLKKLFVVVILAGLACGCKAGVNGLSTDTSDDRTQTIELSFGNISNPTTLELGASVTFSVYYQDQTLVISNCRVEKADGTAFSGIEGGSVSYTDTTCTYTAPGSLPSGVESVNVIATIAYANLTLEATLGVTLSEAAFVPECVNSYDCSNQFCYFGKCLDYDVVGVDTGSECASSDDCAGGYVMCMNIPEISGGDSCQGYCTDLSIFYDENADVLKDYLPTSSGDCGDVENAQWLNAGDPLGYICLTEDMMDCIDGGGGEDSALPISSISPEDGATNVAQDANIVVTFSVPMDESTITSDYFTLSWGIAPITCNMSYDAATRTATCDPADNFAQGVDITVTILDGVKDVEGNSYSSRGWNFRVINGGGGAEMCDNDVDDDSDGFVDCDDTGCAFDSACIEGGPNYPCDDALDNDNDGWADCADSGCLADPSCSSYMACVADENCNVAGGEQCLTFGNHPGMKFCLVDNEAPDIGALTVYDTTYSSLLFLLVTPGIVDGSTDNISPAGSLDYKMCIVENADDGSDRADPTRCDSYPTNYQTAPDANDISISGSDELYEWLVPSSAYTFYVGLADEAGNISTIRSVVGTTLDRQAEGTRCYDYGNACEAGLDCIIDKHVTGLPVSTCQLDIVAPDESTASVPVDKLYPTILFMTYDPYPSDNFTPTVDIDYRVCMIEVGVDPDTKCDSYDTNYMNGSFLGMGDRMYIMLSALDPETEYKIYTTLEDESGNYVLPIQNLTVTTPALRALGESCYNHSDCVSAWCGGGMCGVH